MAQDATLIGGGDTILFENGFLISQVYNEGKIIGKVSHSDYIIVVEKLLEIANKGHCNNNYPINNIELVTIINTFIIWI